MDFYANWNGFAKKIANDAGAFLKAVDTSNARAIIILMHLLFIFHVHHAHIRMTDKKETVPFE